MSLLLLVNKCFALLYYMNDAFDYKSITEISFILALNRQSLKV